MTLSQQAREELIEKTLRAGSQDRRPITWRGQEEYWAVIRLPATSLLLNHRSHRIRAQIKALDAKRQMVENDPYCGESQELIARLIRSTKGYTAVRDTIHRDAQLEPGLITHKGVLINANTRTIAIRETGVQEGYVKVQVLPPDATLAELTTLELKYQMQEEVRQKYSFTNQLLLIDDLFKQKWTPERIGLEIYRYLNPERDADRKEAARRVQDEARLLAIIDLIIAASGGRMTYTDFDDERQTLIEIDQSFESLRKKNQEVMAVRVRDAKITAMLAGLGYEAVRQVDNRFLDDYVAQSLKEEEALEPVAETLLTSTPTATDDDLIGLDFDTPTALDPVDDEPVTIQRIFDALAKTPKDGDVVLDAPAGGRVTMSRDAFKATVNSVFTRAVRSKALDSDRSDAMTAPMKHLATAAGAIDRARKALDDLPHRDRLNTAELNRALRKLTRAWDELSNYLSGPKGFAEVQVNAAIYDGTAHEVADQQ